MDNALPAGNILITSIGSMAGEYSIAALRLANFGKLYGCDCYPKTYLPHSSDLDGFFQIPRSDAPGYENAISLIADAHAIKAILPLTDLEVDFWAEHKQEWENRGIRICIAPASAVRLCRDKYAMAHFFKKQNRVMAIPTYRSDEIAKIPVGRVVAKPRLGRSSEGRFFFESVEEIPKRLFSSDYLFQPYIGGNVFTVDYLRTKNGIDFSIAREELLRTSNGAGTVVKISDSADLKNACGWLGEHLNLLGCVNMEFIKSGDLWYLLDINPRFSAGISFSFQSEYDFVSNHMRCFFDQSPEAFPAHIPVGAIFVKRYQDKTENK